MHKVISIIGFVLTGNAQQYLGSDKFEYPEEDSFVVGNGKGYKQFKLNEDGSICTLIDGQVGKCKTTESDMGFSISTNNRLYERGFLLRFCLEVNDPKEREKITDADFVRNFRANIIAVPANMYDDQPMFWSNVFIEDFRKPDTTEEGKNVCRLTHHLPPNLSGFKNIKLEPRRTIQFYNSWQKKVASKFYPATLDVVPELMRDKYGLQYYFGGIVILIWLVSWPLTYKMKRMINSKFNNKQKPYDFENSIFKHCQSCFKPDEKVKGENKRKWNRLCWVDKAQKDGRQNRACYLLGCCCCCNCCDCGTTEHDDFDDLQTEDLRVQNCFGGCCKEDSCCSSFGCCKPKQINNEKRKDRLNNLNSKNKKSLVEPKLPHIDTDKLPGVIPYFWGEFKAYYTYRKQYKAYSEWVSIIVLWATILSQLYTWTLEIHYKIVFWATSLGFFLLSFIFFFYMVIGQRKIKEFMQLYWKQQIIFILLLFCNIAKITKSNRFNNHKGVMIVTTSVYIKDTTETYEFKVMEKRAFQLMEIEYEKQAKKTLGDPCQANITILENKIKDSQARAGTDRRALIDHRRLAKIENAKIAKLNNSLIQDKDELKVSIYIKYLKIAKRNDNIAKYVESAKTAMDIAFKVVKTHITSDKGNEDSTTREKISEKQAKRLFDARKTINGVTIVWVKTDEVAVPQVTINKQKKEGGEEIAEEWVDFEEDFESGDDDLMPDGPKTIRLKEKAKKEGKDYVAEKKKKSPSKGIDYAEDAKKVEGNPTYTDALLNLMQNVPNFLIQILNVRLIGDSYILVLLLLISWAQAVANCQYIMYDAPKSWGGKHWCFPCKWFCDPKTPTFFKIIVMVTYVFNIFVIALPIALFVITVPRTIETSDYPEWAQANNQDTFDIVLARQTKQLPDIFNPLLNLLEKVGL